MSEAEDFAGLVTTHFSSLGRLSPEHVAELYRHYCLLVRWNRVLNLSSITGVEEIVVRHYCESLFLGLQLPAEAVSVLDVGSGAGFPGIPMAVLRSDCRFTLAESHQRKAVFLREATRHLPNISVVARRAEELAQKYDWVVSRAVKWRDVLKLATGNIGLLLGQEDVAEVLRQPGFVWRSMPLPWGKRRLLVLGERC